MKNAIAIDKAPMRGVFSMRVKDRAGNIIEEYEDHNMIVNGAKFVMAQLISDPELASSCYVKSIVFGDGTAQAQAGDTTLGNLCVTKDIDSFAYPEDTNDRVEFSWSLDYGDGNGDDGSGLNIREFGLLCGDGQTLFSKKTRNAIFKDDSLSLEGTWTIIF